MSKGGVYVYRTRKPASIMGLLTIPRGWLLISTALACAGSWAVGGPWWLGLAVLLCGGRHFAYVGETTSFHHRHRQHLGNVGSLDKHQNKGQPWADLEPKCVARIPLPKWKWLLRTVETLLMLVLAPVYNKQKNLWNPRRIPLASARRQRQARDRRTLPLSFNLRPAHIVATLAAIVFLYVSF